MPFEGKYILCYLTLSKIAHEVFQRKEKMVTDVFNLIFFGNQWALILSVSYGVKSSNSKCIGNRWDSKHGERVKDLKKEGGCLKRIFVKCDWMAGKTINYYFQSSIVLSLYETDTCCCMTFSQNTMVGYTG